MTPATTRGAVRGFTGLHGNASHGAARGRTGPHGHCCTGSRSGLHGAARGTGRRSVLGAEGSPSENWCFFLKPPVREVSCAKVLAKVNLFHKIGHKASFFPQHRKKRICFTQTSGKTRVSPQWGNNHVVSQYRAKIIKILQLRRLSEGVADPVDTVHSSWRRGVALAAQFFTFFGFRVSRV